MCLNMLEIVYLVYHKMCVFNTVAIQTKIKMEQTVRMQHNHLTTMLNFSNLYTIPMRFSSYYIHTNKECLLDYI